MNHGAITEFVQGNQTGRKIPRLNIQPCVNFSMRCLAQWLAQNIRVEQEHDGDYFLSFIPRNGSMAFSRRLSLRIISRASKNGSSSASQPLMSPSDFGLLLRDAVGLIGISCAMG